MSNYILMRYNLGNKNKALIIEDTEENVKSYSTNIIKEMFDHLRTTFSPETLSSALNIFDPKFMWDRALEHLTDEQEKFWNDIKQCTTLEQLEDYVILIPDLVDPAYADSIWGLVEIASYRMRLENDEEFAMQETKKINNRLGIDGECLKLSTIEEHLEYLNILQEASVFYQSEIDAKEYALVIQNLDEFDNADKFDDLEEYFILTDEESETILVFADTYKGITGMMDKLFLEENTLYFDNNGEEKTLKHQDLVENMLSSIINNENSALIIKKGINKDEVLNAEKLSDIIETDYILKTTTLDFNAIMQNLQGLLLTKPQTLDEMNLQSEPAELAAIKTIVENTFTLRQSIENFEDDESLQEEQIDESYFIAMRNILSEHNLYSIKMV